MTPKSVDATTILARHRDILSPPARGADGLPDPSRRRFMGQAGTLGLGLAGAGVLAACHDDGYGYGYGRYQQAPVGDADILTFALNLEYLEAEFYNRAAFGTGLADSMISGRGTPGFVTGGRQVTFTDANVRQYAKEIAADERNHVNFLRNTLGSAGIEPVARPAIDIQNSFTALFRAAGLIGATDTFDPYASEANFLLAAFVFEDVGVTAYKGAASLLANKTYLEAAAGIMAVEAYHASIVRIILYTRGYDPMNPHYGGQSLLNQVDGLSNARDAVDGATDDDQGVDQQSTDIGAASNVAPTDTNGLAYGRTTGEVLNIVYLNTAGGARTGGGFFPYGVNGRIYTSTAN